MTTTTARRRDHGPGPVAGTALSLLDRARAGLLDACHATVAGERYKLAHLAALRSAAALLAGRRAQSTARARPQNVWVLLRTAAPECAEWADFFAGTARRRDQVERGSVTMTVREADDLVRASEDFLECVRACLGLPLQPPIATCVTPARCSVGTR